MILVGDTGLSLNNNNEGQLAFKTRLGSDLSHAPSILEIRSGVSAAADL